MDYPLAEILGWAASGGQLCFRGLWAKCSAGPNITNGDKNQADHNAFIRTPKAMRMRIEFMSTNEPFLL